LQDDFHHFKIELIHDGERVKHISAEAVRYPYSLCPQAANMLGAMVGLPLTRRVFDISASLDARQQCTHQFDLAALAIAATARRQSRRYDLFVTDPVHDLCSANLMRDDGFSLQWHIESDVIRAPEDFGGINVNHGFTAWAAKLTDENMAEAALVLRRAHFVARGRARLKELNEQVTAMPRSSCYVMQPYRALSALRIVTQVREGISPITVSAEDQNWLSGD